VALLAITALATVAALSDADPRDSDATVPPTPPPVTTAPAGPEETGVETTPEPERGGVLVVWARGDLTPAFSTTVAAVPQVLAATHVRSDTLALVGARTADGVPMTLLSDGFQIPVDVAAVDPAAYAATRRPGEDDGLLDGLSPRRILLSQTAARLRGIGVGGEVDLAGLPGLEVVGVVPDESVGRAEIVIHTDDAAAAGLDEDGTVFLRHAAAPGVELDALMDRIEAIIPPDLTARIVDATDGDLRRAPLVLSLAQVKDRFGEFAFRSRDGVREIDVDPTFAAGHIVSAEVPILGSVTCHELIIADLRGALQRVVDEGLAHEVDPRRYAGCYHPRRISTTGARLSHHSWGIAIDINVDLSHPELGPAPHPGVIAAFEAHGFRWGGDFIQPDNHHFEWVGEVTDPPGRWPDRPPGR
jgi:hypothetical protein